jgi:tRNA-2-methylthio-N6-dimethylallyladenosine synthase
MADGTLADLATLIHFVAAIDGVERIRFTTSHPLEFNDSLIEAYANVPKLNNFLHLPVQSGSDRILAAMKRGHTVLEYKQKLAQAARGAARHLHFHRPHRRLSRRDRRGFHRRP